MVTVAEKQADVATFIDDLAAMLGADSTTGLADWSDADPNVTNGGASGGWRDNARVFKNANTGHFLLFYIKNTTDVFAGVRFVISTDWDTQRSEPAGYTNLQGNDDMWNEDNIRFSRGKAFRNLQSKQSHADLGVSIKQGNNTGISRTTSMTYFMSAGNDYITACGWNTTDGTYGESGFAVYEWADNKFWDDGQDPFFAVGKVGYKDDPRTCSMYGWSTYEAGHPNNTGGPTPGPSDIAVGGSFYDGKWGIINPDANDDTFFFRRPVVFETHRKDNPVAYVEDVVYNDLNDGAAHGDVVTVGTTDYQSFRQAGGTGTGTITALLRYE